MADVIIYGVGLYARLAAAYLSWDSPHDVVAFVGDVSEADPALQANATILDASDVARRFPPGDHAMLAAVSTGFDGGAAERAFGHARDLGYELITYVSSRASVWPGAIVGDGCLILERSVVQAFAEIHDGAWLSPGCHIGHESIVGRYSRIGARSVVSGNVSIGERCHIGSNAAIRNGISLAAGTVVGPGATVLASTSQPTFVQTEASLPVSPPPAAPREAL